MTVSSPRLGLLVCFASFVWTLSGPKALAQDAAPSAPPTVVAMGVFLAQIQDIDLKSRTASVAFYVWTRWRGELDGTAYEVMNGVLESKENEYRVEHEGWKYAIYRCRATVLVSVDYRLFPFDEHELTIAFEHSDYGSSTLVFEVDRRAVRDLRTPEVRGWIVGAPTYRISESTYRTNWGMMGVGPEESTRSSRFTVAVTLRHAPVATAAKTFLALFIAALITALGFLIDPSDLGSRVGVGVAGTFGAVTSQAVVSANLPDIPYTTLSDKVHFAVLAFIFGVLLESCLVGHLARTERVTLASRIDRFAGVCGSLALVGWIVALVVMR